MKRFIVIEDERTAVLLLRDTSHEAAFVNIEKLAAVVHGGSNKANDRQIFEAVADILNAVSANGGREF